MAEEELLLCIKNHDEGRILIMLVWKSSMLF